MSDLTDALADTPLASDGYVFVYGIVVTESVSVSDSVTYKVTPGGLASDTAYAGDSAAITTVVLSTALTSSARAAGAFKVISRASVTESAGASDAYAPALGTPYVERASASDAYALALSYTLTLQESARAREAWAYASAGEITDSATASDVWVFDYDAQIVLVETASSMDGFAGVRRASASLVESVSASDASALTFNYAVSLVESACAYVIDQEPSGSITAWAINTRTTATTEYQNFAFNSFASMGRKYIAASADGLYELNGASDDGTQVNANLVGGFFQANGMKFMGLKGVYLSVGGQGPGAATGAWTLDLTMGDQRSFTYKTISNPGMMVTKFNIGKGLRANYMAWALSNADGQDFDFDKIEFVPMMSGRRI